MGILYRGEPFQSHRTLLFALLALSLAGTALGETNASPRFVQDRLAVGFWVDPPADQQTDARFAEIADANFTFVIGNFGATTPDAVTNQLNLCAKHGLKAIVATAGLPPDKLPDAPACWGYSLADEPGSGAFPQLAQTVETLRKARPGKLAYINLLPNYATPAMLGTTSYVEHLERFVREVHPDVLSMDHYPQFKPGVDGRPGYCANLAAMRDASLRADIPFWNFFNTMPYGDHFDPTEAQLRWQIFTSLAYGAKGVMYFCYWTPGGGPGGEFPKGGAIIRRDGTRTRHYDEARRINAVLKNYGPTLMKLTSTGVDHVKVGDASKDSTNSPVRLSPSGDYLVGKFRHADGRRAILLVNYGIAYAQWPTVDFGVAPERVIEIDPNTGREAPVKDDSPDMDGLQVSLDAGQGRLFILPATK
jgi:hypothetical protein